MTLNILDSIKIKFFHLETKRVSKLMPFGGQRGRYFASNSSSSNIKAAFGICDPKNLRNCTHQAICFNYGPYFEVTEATASWRSVIILEAIFNISYPKNLEITIHKAINWSFNFGLHFKAKEASTRPYEGKISIQRPYLIYMLPKKSGN